MPTLDEDLIEWLYLGTEEEEDATDDTESMWKDPSEQEPPVPTDSLVLFQYYCLGLAFFFSVTWVVCDGLYHLYTNSRSTRDQMPSIPTKDNRVIPKQHLQEGSTQDTTATSILPRSRSSSLIALSRPQEKLRAHRSHNRRLRRRPTGQHVATSPVLARGDSSQTIRPTNSTSLRSLQKKPPRKLGITLRSQGTVCPVSQKGNRVSSEAVVDGIGGLEGMPDMSGDQIDRKTVKIGNITHPVCGVAVDRFQAISCLRDQPSHEDVSISCGSVLKDVYMQPGVGDEISIGVIQMPQRDIDTETGVQKNPKVGDQNKRKLRQRFSRLHKARSPRCDSGGVDLEKATSDLLSGDFSINCGGETTDNDADKSLSMRDRNQYYRNSEARGDQRRLFLSKYGYQESSCDLEEQEQKRQFVPHDVTYPGPSNWAFTSSVNRSPHPDPASLVVSNDDFRGKAATLLRKAAQRCPYAESLSSTDTFPTYDRDKIVRIFETYRGHRLRKRTQPDPQLPESTAKPYSDQPYQSQLITSQNNGPRRPMMSNGMDSYHFGEVMHWVEHATNIPSDMREPCRNPSETANPDGTAGKGDGILICSPISPPLFMYGEFGDKDPGSPGLGSEESSAGNSGESDILSYSKQNIKANGQRGDKRRSAVYEFRKPATQRWKRKSYQDMKQETDISKRMDSTYVQDAKFKGKHDITADTADVDISLYFNKSRKAAKVGKLFDSHQKFGGDFLEHGRDPQDAIRPHKRPKRSTDEEAAYRLKKLTKHRNGSEARRLTLHGSHPQKPLDEFGKYICSHPQTVPRSRRDFRSHRSSWAFNEREHEMRCQNSDLASASGCQLVQNKLNEYQHDAPAPHAGSNYQHIMRTVDFSDIIQQVAEKGRQLIEASKEDLLTRIILPPSEIDYDNIGKEVVPKMAPGAIRRKYYGEKFRPYDNPRAARHSAFSGHEQHSDKSLDSSPVTKSINLQITEKATFSLLTSECSPTHEREASQLTACTHISNRPENRPSEYTDDRTYIRHSQPSTYTIKGNHGGKVHYEMPKLLRQRPRMTHYLLPAQSSRHVLTDRTDEPWQISETGVCSDGGDNSLEYNDSSQPERVDEAGGVRSNGGYKLESVYTSENTLCSTMDLLSQVTLDSNTPDQVWEMPVNIMENIQKANEEYSIGKDGKSHKVVIELLPTDDTTDEEIARKRAPDFQKIGISLAEHLRNHGPPRGHNHKVNHDKKNRKRNGQGRTFPVSHDLEDEYEHRQSKYARERGQRKNLDTVIKIESALLPPTRDTMHEAHTEGRAENKPFSGQETHRIQRIKEQISFFLDDCLKDHQKDEFDQTKSDSTSESQHLSFDEYASNSKHPKTKDRSLKNATVPNRIGKEAEVDRGRSTRAIAGFEQNEHLQHEHMGRADKATKQWQSKEVRRDDHNFRPPFRRKPDREIAITSDVKENWASAFAFDQKIYEKLKRRNRQEAKHSRAQNTANLDEAAEFTASTEAIVSSSRQDNPHSGPGCGSGHYLRKKASSMITHNHDKKENYVHEIAQDDHDCLPSTMSVSDSMLSDPSSSRSSGEDIPILPTKKITRAHEKEDGKDSNLQFHKSQPSHASAQNGTDEMQYRRQDKSEGKSRRNKHNAPTENTCLIPHQNVDVDQLTEEAPTVESGKNGSDLINLFPLAQRLRHVCSPTACRLCGTHTEDNTTCDMGKVEEKTSHQEYMRNAQKVLNRGWRAKRVDVDTENISQDNTRDEETRQVSKTAPQHRQDEKTNISKTQAKKASMKDLKVESKGNARCGDRKATTQPRSKKEMFNQIMSKIKAHKTRTTLSDRVAKSHTSSKDNAADQRQTDHRYAVCSEKPDAARKQAICAEEHGHRSKAVTVGGRHNENEMLHMQCKGRSPTPTSTEHAQSSSSSSTQDSAPKPRTTDKGKKDGSLSEIVLHQDYVSKSDVTASPEDCSPRFLSSPVPGYQRATHSSSQKTWRSPNSPSPVASGCARNPSYHEDGSPPCSAISPRNTSRLHRRHPSNSKTYPRWSPKVETCPQKSPTQRQEKHSFDHRKEPLTAKSSKAHQNTSAKQTYEDTKRRTVKSHERDESATCKMSRGKYINTQKGLSGAERGKLHVADFDKKTKQQPRHRSEDQHHVDKAPNRASSKAVRKLPSQAGAGEGTTGRQRTPEMASRNTAKRLSDERTSSNRKRSVAGSSTNAPHSKEKRNKLSQRISSRRHSLSDISETSEKCSFPSPRHVDQTNWRPTFPQAVEPVGLSVKQTKTSLQRVKVSHRNHEYLDARYQQPDDAVYDRTSNPQRKSNKSQPPSKRFRSGQRGVSEEGMIRGRRSQNPTIPSGKAHDKQNDKTKVKPVFKRSHVSGARSKQDEEKLDYALFTAQASPKRSSSSRASLHASSLYTFTEVECPGESTIRRTKLLRILEDTLHVTEPVSSDGQAENVIRTSPKAMGRNKMVFTNRKMPAQNINAPHSHLKFQKLEMLSTPELQQVALSNHPANSPIRTRAEGCDKNDIKSASKSSPQSTPPKTRSSPKRNSGVMGRHRFSKSINSRNKQAHFPSDLSTLGQNLSYERKECSSHSKMNEKRALFKGNDQSCLLLTNLTKASGDPSSRPQSPLPLGCLSQKSPECPESGGALPVKSMKFQVHDSDANEEPFTKQSSELKNAEAEENSKQEGHGKLAMNIAENIPEHVSEEFMQSCGGSVKHSAVIYFPHADGNPSGKGSPQAPEGNETAKDMTPAKTHLLNVIRSFQNEPSPLAPNIPDKSRKGPVARSTRQSTIRWKASKSPKVSRPTTFRGRKSGKSPVESVGRMTSVRSISKHSIRQSSRQQVKFPSKVKRLIGTIGTSPVRFKERDALSSARQSSSHHFSGRSFASPQGASGAVASDMPGSTPRGKKIDFHKRKHGSYTVAKPVLSPGSLAIKAGQNNSSLKKSPFSSRERNRLAMTQNFHSRRDVENANKHLAMATTNTDYRLQFSAAMGPPKDNCDFKHHHNNNNPSDNKANKSVPDTTYEDPQGSPSIKSSNKRRRLRRDEILWPWNTTENNNMEMSPSLHGTSQTTQIHSTITCSSDGSSTRRRRVRAQGENGNGGLHTSTPTNSRNLNQRQDSIQDPQDQNDAIENSRSDPSTVSKVNFDWYKPSTSQAVQASPVNNQDTVNRPVNDSTTTLRERRCISRYRHYCDGGSASEGRSVCMRRSACAGWSACEDHAQERRSKTTGRQHCCKELAVGEGCSLASARLNSQLKIQSPYANRNKRYNTRPAFHPGPSVQSSSSGSLPSACSAGDSQENLNDLDGFSTPSLYLPGFGDTHVSTEERQDHNRLFKLMRRHRAEDCKSYFSSSTKCQCVRESVNPHSAVDSLPLSREPFTFAASPNSRCKSNDDVTPNLNTHLQGQHTPHLPLEQPSAAYEATVSNQTSTSRPLHNRQIAGFSYLYHDAAQAGSRQEVDEVSPNRVHRPAIIRVKRPGENTFVGQIVKMFETQVQFRPPKSG